MQLLSTPLYSQKETDIGLFFGTSYYQGDLNPTRHFYSPGFSGGINYRYNLNPRYVLKGGVNYLQLSANDADFTNDRFQMLRAAKFSSSVYDLSAQFEFNFLPLKFDKQKFYITPFVSSGAAVAFVLMSTVDPIPKFTLPLDIGARVAFKRKWSVGVQWCFRKAFTDDRFDAVSNPFDESMKSLFNNNDWYSFAGLFVTYKLFDIGGNCPAYPGGGHGLNMYK